MTTLPATRRSVYLLSFAYWSAIAIIVILLGAAQGLVQWTLAREQHERGVAAQIATQELRTQRMYFNALFLQNPAPGTDYSVLTARLAADEPAWEATQQAMYSGSDALGIEPGDFSASSLAVIAGERNGFEHMQAAYRHALALEESAHFASPDEVRPDIVVIYEDEPAYLSSLVTIYNDETSAADDLVNLVRLIELVLFCATLAVMTCEVLLVVRPAFKSLNEALHDFNQALANKTPDGDAAPHQ